MRNIAVSFITGSVFGSIIFIFIFDVNPESRVLPEAHDSELMGEVVPSRVNLDTAPALSRSEPVSEPTEPQFEDSPDVAVGGAAVDPVERLAELAAIIRAANREAIEIDRGRWLASLGPIVSPVPLSPEFHWFGWNTFHEEMQREPIDFTASLKEAEITQYLFSRPQMIQQYGTPTVRCHTNRCLVTWISYGSSESASEFQSDFLGLADAADEELTTPLSCDVADGCVSRTHVEDGIATAIWGVKFEGKEVVPGLE